MMKIKSIFTVMKISKENRCDYEKQSLLQKLQKEEKH